MLVRYDTVRAGDRDDDKGFFVFVLFQLKKKLLFASLLPTRKLSTGRRGGNYPLCPNRPLPLHKEKKGSDQLVPKTVSNPCGHVSSRSINVLSHIFMSHLLRKKAHLRSRRTPQQNPFFFFVK
jgi:hypothetical protein